MSYTPSLDAQIASAEKISPQRQTAEGRKYLEKLKKQREQINARLGKADAVRTATEGSRQPGVVEGHDASNPGIQRVRDRGAQQVTSEIKQAEVTRQKEQAEQVRLAKEQNERALARQQIVETPIEKQRREAEAIERNIAINACAILMKEQDATPAEISACTHWLGANGYAKPGQPCYDRDAWLSALIEVRSQMHAIRAMRKEAEQLNGGSNEL